MNIAMMLSGLFFLLIIITNITGVKFGWETFSDLDSDAKIQMINKDPKKFKISVALLLIEHVCIISLSLTLFIAFSPYNIILGIVWTISRIGEASVQIYYKKTFWGLLNISRKYSDASGDEKIPLVDSARIILKTKNSIFNFAQVFFSIGTLAYSILFVSYGVVPIFIGWFGIVASLIYGIGNGVMLVKKDFKGVWGLGGLLILLFELVLGGWLLFFSPFFT